MAEKTRRGFLKTSVAATGAVAGIAAGARVLADETTARSIKSFALTRQIPAETGYDLIVAGGGPAGSAAAICAARLGAKVLLAEATGCLGGMGTSGMVSAWSNLTDGKRPVIGGLMAEIAATLRKRNQLVRYRYDGAGFNTEAQKVLLDDLCAAAGVEVRFFTKVIDAEVDRKSKKLEGLILHNIEGYHYIPAKTFIDATGDAVLSDICGAACREAGRNTRNIMPPTLCSYQAGIDFKQFRNQQRCVLKAIKDGFFSQPDRHVPGIFRTGETTAILNAGHVFRMNALKCRSLSDGMVRGRKLAKEYVEFYRKYVPGCEKMEFTATAALMGVRESRRIVGEYELSHADYKARRHFPDQIAVYSKQVDVHVYDASEEEYKRYRKHFSAPLKRGETYGLPYGILVPKGWRNLWTAGRCNSSDIEVHGAIRDQPACYMMGQAAGTAAVQSLRTGQQANSLDTAVLIETLRKAGAHLPQKTTSKTMTRSQTNAKAVIR